MRKDEIVIIGTEPPCPRCDYLAHMAQDIVNLLGLSIDVRHIAYSTDESRRFAASLGLDPGTAKDVAAKAAVDVDWDRVHALIDEPDQITTISPELACCPTIATKWSPALDEVLRPCERIAQAAGIMMTPVLVLGGRLLHQGSVPERRQVYEWVQEYFPRGADKSPCQYTIEVLGSGCAKCDTLYDNTRQAVALLGLDDRVSIRKRTDMAYFQEMGVSVTPSLVVNRIVVSIGKVLSVDQVVEQLNGRLFG